MKKSLFFRKGVMALLMAAATLVACSKNNDDDSSQPPSTPENPHQEWPIKPNIKEGEANYITFYTDAKQGEKLMIRADAKSAWIDLNNNGIQDPDEPSRENENILGRYYQIKSQIITVYGEVRHFAVEGKVKAIDLSHAPNLKFLGFKYSNINGLDLSKLKMLKELTITNNDFSAETILAIAKTLPQREKNYDAQIVLQRFAGEKKETNKITPEILEVLAAKNWDAYYMDERQRLIQYNGNIDAPQRYKGWDVTPFIKKGVTDYISFFTKAKKGSEIKLKIRGEGFWVDLNNNGQQDDNEYTNEFIVDSPVITVYGSISSLFTNDDEGGITLIDLSHAKYINELGLNNNKISKLDISQNKDLNGLYLANNYFSRDELLAIANALPERNKYGIGEILLETREALEHNQVDKRVLAALIAKNWTPRYIDQNGDGYPYDGIDPESSGSKVPKGKYGIYIGGVEITSDNYDKINSTNFPAVQKGEVTYDPVKCVLTLEGATIETKEHNVRAIHRAEGTATLTIKLIFTSYIYTYDATVISTLSSPLCIVGGGAIRAQTRMGGDAISFYSKGDLTIKDNSTVVSVDRLFSKNKIIVNKSNVRINGSYGTFQAEKGIELIDCEVEKPKGAIVKTHVFFYTFTKDGNPCQEIEIKAKN